MNQVTPPISTNPGGCGRRDFLAGLLAFGVGAPVLAATASQPAKRTVLLNKVYVAGLRYHDGQTLLDHDLLPTGEPVALVPEPDNPHDPFAVRLEAQGRKLGYVPRTENHHLSRCLRVGEELSARVLEVRADEPVSRRVRVEISLVC